VTDLDQLAREGEWRRRIVPSRARDASATGTFDLAVPQDGRDDENAVIYAEFGTPMRIVEDAPEPRSITPVRRVWKRGKWTAGRDLSTL